MAHARPRLRRHGGAWLQISPLYENAFRRATDDERAMALLFLENWLKGRRD